MHTIPSPQAVLGLGLTPERLVKSFNERAQGFFLACSSGGYLATIFQGTPERLPGKWWGLERITRPGSARPHQRAFACVVDNFGDLVEVPA